MSTASGSREAAAREQVDDVPPLIEMTDDQWKRHCRGLREMIKVKRCCKCKQPLSTEDLASGWKMCEECRKKDMREIAYLLGRNGF